MTNEEAIEHLNTIGQYYSQDHSDPYEECEVLTKDELDAIYTAIKAIEQTTWIPVSERLPETEERILILFDDGFVMIGHYIDWQDGTPITWVLDGQEDYNVDTNNIIAWMPLPSYQGE